MDCRLITVVVTCKNGEQMTAMINTGSTGTCATPTFCKANGCVWDSRNAGTVPVLVLSIYS
jgi:hypothetical protein